MAVAEVPDPVERLRRLGSELAAMEARHRAEYAELRRLRGAAVRELLELGWSLADIAGEIGLTRQQVFRLSRDQ